MNKHITFIKSAASMWTKIIRKRNAPFIHKKLNNLKKTIHKSTNGNIANANSWDNDIHKYYETDKTSTSNDRFIQILIQRQKTIIMFGSDNVNHIHNMQNAI